MTHIQQRRDPSTTWASVNPVLFEGEAGHETDTGKWKLGDGVTAWADLPYKSGVDTVAGRTGEVTLAVTDVEGAAPLASPALTGSPTAPTPATADNDTSVATTAFVKAQGYATVDSPAFTGNPTVPTPVLGDDDTSVANTAFVKDVIEAALAERQAAEAWQSWTPKFSAAPGYSLVYARYRILNEDTCHVQVAASNFQTSAFNPGFVPPVPFADHYRLGTVPSGYLGEMFPGTVRWAGAPDQPNDVGVLTWQVLDFGDGAGPTDYIMGNSRTGGALALLSNPAAAIYWESIYEIDPGSA